MSTKRYNKFGGVRNICLSLGRQNKYPLINSCHASIAWIPIKWPIFTFYPARLTRDSFLPKTALWHSSPVSVFLSPVQFNTTLFSYGSFPVLGLGTLRHMRGGPALKTSLSGSGTNIDWPQFLPDSWKEFTYEFLFSDVRAPRGACKLGSAERQAHLCVFPGECKALCTLSGLPFFLPTHHRINFSSLTWN